ncbi:MAG: hypothetical protein ACTSQY_07715 [Candidatus Odinarchaeia archaeon]
MEKTPARNSYSNIKKQRENITNKLIQVENEIKNNRLQNALNYIRENPLVILAELLISGGVFFIVLLPLYNFLFITPPSPLTVVLFVLLMGFIVIIPLNLIFSMITTKFKKKKLNELKLRENIANLKKYELEYLQEIFAGFKVDYTEKNIKIFDEMEVNEEILYSSFFFNIYTFKKDNETLAIEGDRMYKSIFGNYLFLKYTDGNRFEEMNIRIRNNIMFKCKKNREQVRLQLLPTNRNLVKKLFRLSAILSKNKKIDVQISGDTIIMVIYEPSRLNPEWIKADTLGVLRELSKLLKRAQIWGVDNNRGGTLYI